MIVVDASVVTNALVDPGAAGTSARLVLRTENHIAAPDLIDVETVSALRGLWLAGRATDRLFRTALGDLSVLPIVRQSARRFLGRCYELRANITSYDALYVALAEALECALVTGDARLAAAPGPTCEIRLIEA